METPTCVIDASALIEHIHEIKTWTYDGRVRLVVPLCTLERVQQLLRKQTEEQEAKKPDPPRQRSSWKPTRKEHPAFDINLRVALEFLTRAKASEIEEIQGSVAFQQTSEEYSPWKGIELQPERKEPTEDRPSTFAQALTKSIKADHLSAVNPSNGLAKPKLVARASPAETSPWKTNKNAPKISLGEVPELLRPLFSFTLWRIYEHVTLNDSNQTVLLSNEPLVYRAAQNLNITVMRIEELRCIVNSNKMVDLDCDVYGDLEREFGPRTSKALHQKRPNIDVGIEDVASQDYEYIDRNKELVMSANGNHITTENSSDNSMSLTASDSGKHLFEHKQNDDILGMQQEVLSDIHDEQKNVQKSVEESILKVNGECEKSIDSKQVFSKESTPTVMEEAKLATVERPAITYQDNKEFDDKNSIFTTKNLAGNISTKVENDLAKRPITKTNGILKRNESVIDNGYIALEKKDAVVSDNRSDLSQPLSYSRSATLDNSSPSSRRSSDVSNPTLTKPAQDLEDSDEEVVVFNPRAKRLSAQKKTSNQGRKILAPPQKISSETSPSETISKVISSEATSPKIFSMTTSPKLASNQTASSKTTYPDTSPKMTSPKLVSPKKASPNTSSTSPNLGSSKLTAPKNAVAKINNGRSNHPRNSRPRTPVAPAAIIDPDFFGRSSVVSIRPNASNGYARHSPRGSPRRGPRNVDSEVDYVLTSGATREATRGKGKLWVP